MIFGSRVTVKSPHSRCLIEMKPVFSYALVNYFLIPWALYPKSNHNLGNTQDYGL